MRLLWRQFDLDDEWLNSEGSLSKIRRESGFPEVQSRVAQLARLFDPSPESREKPAEILESARESPKMSRTHPPANPAMGRLLTGSLA